MDDLAEELGMSKKTLYAHFESKMALLQAVIEAKVRSADADLEQIAAESALNFPAALHHLLACLRQHSEELQPSFLRDIAREAPELFKMVQMRRSELIQRHFGKLLAEGRKAGMIRKDKDIATDLMIEILIGATTSLINPQRLTELGLSAENGLHRHHRDLPRRSRHWKGKEKMRRASTRLVDCLRHPFFTLCALCLFAGCQRAQRDVMQGYIEGEFVYVASPLGGELETLSVQRGAQVKAGESLFALECGAETAARDQATKRLEEGRAQFEDAKKGKRAPEIEAIDAQLRQSRAALVLSEKEFVRQTNLARSGASSPQDLDRARSVRDQDQQRVSQQEADLKTAQLGLRTDQIAAAEANVRALEADSQRPIGIFRKSVRAQCSRASFSIRSTVGVSGWQRADRWSHCFRQRISRCARLCRRRAFRRFIRAIA